jgi:pyocin large subunit-like protein
MRPKLWLSALLCLLAAACGGNGTLPPAAPAEAPPALTERVPLPKAESAPPGFPSRRSFEQHFEKHGVEFGRITPAEYLALAQQLRDRPAGGPLLEDVRNDGVVARFDRETGHFGVYNPDRTIRTFFIPTDGERYFHRQARRPR